MERRRVGDVGGARSVVVLSIRTHQIAVEVLTTGRGVEVVAQCTLATVTPAIRDKTLVEIFANLNGAGDLAGLKIAIEFRVDVTLDAAETERRSGLRGNVLDCVCVAQILNLRIIVDVVEAKAQTVNPTTSIRTKGTIVSAIAIFVNRVVDTGDVVAITASTTATARLMSRGMLATVARITVAIEVEVRSVASIDATTSGRGGSVRIASYVGGSELARVDVTELSAVVRGNEWDVVLRVGDVGSGELVVEDATSVSERGLHVREVLQVKGVLNEGRAVDNSVEPLVVIVGRTPELPPVSTIVMGDVAKGLGAVLAQRAIVFATISEVVVAVSPAMLADEWALASPVITSLAHASFNSLKMARLHEGRVVHNRTAVVSLAASVVDGSLATSAPVRVSVGAEARIANGEVALADTGIGDTLAPVEGVKTIKGVALNALAARAASTVVEDVSLATGHRVRVAVLPASNGVALVVALASVRISRVVHAGDPVSDRVLVEVRARENVAVTSRIVIRGERPKLEEWAPNTADGGANGVRELRRSVTRGIVWPIETEVNIIISEVVVEAKFEIICL